MLLSCFQCYDVVYTRTESVLLLLAWKNAGLLQGGCSCVLRSRFVCAHTAAACTEFTAAAAIFDFVHSVW